MISVIDIYFLNICIIADEKARNKFHKYDSMGNTLFYNFFSSTYLMKDKSKFKKSEQHRKTIEYQLISPIY